VINEAPFLAQWIETDAKGGQRHAAVGEAPDEDAIGPYFKPPLVSRESQFGNETAEIRNV